MGDEKVIDVSDIGDEMLGAINAFRDGDLTSEEFGDRYTDLVHRGGRRFSEGVQAQAHDVAVRHEAELAPFLIRLRARWRRPLELFASHMVYARQVGQEFSAGYEDEAVQTKDMVFFATRLLHARACRLAGEVHTLMAGGYASGAVARWRTLHELAVVSNIIGMKGDHNLANRYLDHAAIHDERDARWFRNTFPDAAVVSDEDYEALHAEKRRLIEEYPDGRYDSDYGWAVPVVGKSQPTFEDLESHADLGNWRPTYKVANHDVHSDSKSAHETLVYRGEVPTLLSGPSNIGLAEPATHSMNSLTIATIAFLVGNHSALPQPDHAMAVIALGELAVSAATEFEAVEQEIMAEEQAEWE